MPQYEPVGYTWRCLVDDFYNLFVVMNESKVTLKQQVAVKFYEKDMIEYFRNKGSLEGFSKDDLASLVVSMLDLRLSEGFENAMALSRILGESKFKNISDYFLKIPGASEKLIFRLFESNESVN